MTDTSIHIGDSNNQSQHNNSDPTGGVAPEPSIEAVAEELRQVFREAKLGLDAKAFLDSDLGQAVIARATDETESIASELLYRTDATDVVKITDLKIRAAGARDAIRFITETLNSGLQAEAVLKQIEDEKDEDSLYEH
jgi:hypothetical protein